MPDKLPDKRLGEGIAWASEALAAASFDCTVVTGDASFRRYFRLHSPEFTYILLDAPPDLEELRPFIDIDHRLREANLHAPEIHAMNLEQGFLLLEDLGDQLYAGLLGEETAEELFEESFCALETMAHRVNSNGLPEYNRKRLIEELDLFPQWYLLRHHGIRLKGSRRKTWESLCDSLVRSAQSQPQVFVHRDFHSCNLLKTSTDSPGIIDFQDALLGPLGYDLASLLWDRYITWPRKQLECHMENYRQRLGLDIAPGKWRQQCDWMGLQRNLKIIGIFARLHYRDEKDGYLQMIPRFWSYVIDVVGRYPELKPFQTLLEQLKCAP